MRSKRLNCVFQKDGARAPRAIKSRFGFGPRLVEGNHPRNVRASLASKIILVKEVLCLFF